MVFEFTDKSHCRDCGYKPGDPIVTNPKIPIIDMPDNCPKCHSTNIYRPPVAKDRKPSPFKKF